ncbi:hypothetical protein F383_30902 [Gossypium arboreum]|uniref:Uncharacterized protein n=1 Tax=Gossypium arboreum TaxID=29729 RepID=A0A0B0PGS6_GOSAR|nr:hypothetical protein F383_30902 [Gossypium arboreum]
MASAPIDESQCKTCLGHGISLKICKLVSDLSGTWHQLEPQSMEASVRPVWDMAST